MCRRSSVSRFAVGQAIILACAIASATAHPNDFAANYAASCTDHPRMGFGQHEAPVADMSTTFTLIPADAATPTPATSLCPGYTYQVTLDYGGVPRDTLLTATLGTLKSSRDNACPNRAVGLTTTPIYNDQLVVPCKANAGSSLLLKVTSAGAQTDNYHQASATYPINTLDKCPSSSCEPVATSTGGSSSVLRTSPAGAAAAGTSAVNPASKQTSAGTTSKASVSTADSTTEKSSKANEGTPVFGTGVLARLLNITTLQARSAATPNGVSISINNKGNTQSDAKVPGSITANEVAAAAGPAAAAAMTAAARSSSAPRKAGGEFPVLNQLSAAAKKFREQFAAPGANRTASRPFLTNLVRAAGGAAQNMTQELNATTASQNTTFAGVMPALEAAMGMRSSSALANPVTGNRDVAGVVKSTTSSGVEPVTGTVVGSQWQDILQKLQKALIGARQQVQATSGPVSVADVLEVPVNP